jgi:hypothetical protein
VAEIQGLYGTFSFPEKLLQKIWMRGDFDRRSAELEDGRRVEILYSGKWNLLGGPDFRGARLRFGDGAEVCGDVELHLNAADWVAHGHADDRAYDGVLLHVVLFPPGPGRVTVGAGGNIIPVLALLPLLHHDLEEFAAEEAVEALVGRTLRRVPDALFALSASELSALLRTHAEERWRQKVHFARLKIGRLGWEAACHHAALEILGYRFNRAAMSRVAGRWPLCEWAAGKVDPADAFSTEQGNWILHGVRPANHPRGRLVNYREWTQRRGDWPERLTNVAIGWPELGWNECRREARRQGDFPGLRREFAEVTGGVVGGSRLDTLICDGFLPLLAARGPAEAGIASVWCHWYPGDLPVQVVSGLRQLGLCGRRSQPLGVGLAQGLLGWWIHHEARLQAG